MLANLTDEPRTAAAVFEELRQQHEVLRELLDTSEILLDDLDRGDATVWQLTREVRRLRKAFDVHNTFEEELLRDLPDTPVLAERHAEEHATIRDGLGDRPPHELRHVVELLRAHLDAEDRYLLERLVGAA